LVAGDTENARFKIYRFDERFQSVQIVGREGSAAGEFSHGLVAKLRGLTIYHQVQGIAVDKNGNIFVIDQGNQRIQVFDPGGKALPEKTIALNYCPAETPRCAQGLWRAVKGQYTSLQGLAIDQDGGVFVSDRGTSRIYRFLSDGRLDPSFYLPEADLTTGKPILKEPESMALYQDKLFVANEGTGDIKILDRKRGTPVGPAASFGADVFAGDAEGLAVVRDYLFAVDVQNTRIAVFDLTSTPPKFLMGFVGDYESADGIAIDPTGKYVAVADQGNLRVVLYSLPEILDHLATTEPKQ
jgi:sugar lactone lactonase YvrE